MKMKWILFFLALLLFAPLSSLAQISQMTHPTLAYKTEPNYTKEARRAGIEGRVTLAVTVDANGAPRDITVTSPLHPELDRQAVSAVQEWKFNPAVLNGNPIAVRTTVEVNFRLTDPSGRTTDRRPPQLHSATTAETNVNAPVFLAWSEGCRSCLKEYQKGVLHKGGYTESVFLWVSLHRDRNLHFAYVSVTNVGHASVDVVPANFRLIHKSDEHNSLSVNEMRGRIRGKYKWALISNELSSLASKYRCGYVGYSYVCVPYNDPASEEIYRRRASEIESTQSQAVSRMEEFLLDSETLGPGENVSGAVYFRETGKKAAYSLVIPIGSETFQFPFASEEVKKD